MGQFKGTPGEWLVSDNGMFFDINCGNQKIGDTCASQHEFDNSVHMDGGVAAANAQLIATAPELLEALQCALEWIDNVPSDARLPMMPGFDRDWVDGIIAKALGE